MSAPAFSDNTRVRAGRTLRDGGYSGNEYLALSLAPPEEDLPYTVQLKRYCVPGRCWTYAFQWTPSTRQGIGDRLSYGSEGNAPLAKALKQVVADLDRPQVVALCRRAVMAERIALTYGRELIELLDVLAPRSKTRKAVAAMVEEVRQERLDRLVAAKQVDPQVAARLEGTT